MKDVEYERMAEVEARMWWYRNLHHNVLAVLASALGKPLDVSLADRSVLDAGCGTGGILQKLEAAAPRAVLHGIDISLRAVDYARSKTTARLYQGSIDALPYDDASFDVIVSLDVLCVRNVDEVRALGEFRRCLKPGGLLVVNLPAYMWMRSYHDEHVGSARRYTRSGAERLFERQGLRTRAAGYWNTTLFPLMVVRRKLLPANREGSDVRMMPRAMEAAFYLATYLERLLVRANLLLPFGGSVIWAGTRT